MMGRVSEDIVTYRNGWWIVGDFSGVVIGLVMIIAGALSGNWFWYLAGGSFLGIGVYLLLTTSYEATIGPGNELLFRGVARTQSLFVEDVRQVQRISGEGTTYWKFSFVQGSARLKGSAGHRLAERLLQLNPTIVDASSNGFLFRMHGDKPLAFDLRDRKSAPQSVSEPDWVKQGEKVSAQELLRRQREAERTFQEARRDGQSQSS
jgi:hypothetical protein